MLTLITEKISLNKNPIKEFEDWYQEACTIGSPFPDAMTLATANKQGRPSARIVLYKGISRGGFLIFTNYESQKAKDMVDNPYAALVFHWPSTKKQVRIEGHVKKLSLKESDQYFSCRPRGSQLGAWASKQSAVIPSRQYLLDRFAETERAFLRKKISLPPFWGGFRLIPEKIEFWIDREHRLHDRFLYVRDNRKWKISRLAP